MTDKQYQKLLEGLGITEIKFSTAFANKDFRTDGDFWVKEPKPNSKLKYDKIGNCLINAQYGISIEMNEEGKGYPIYRMNEIHNMLCDIEVSKKAEITKAELEIFKLNDRDVLFNRTNSFEWVGRTGLYRKADNSDFIFASYLVRFIPNQKIILPEYLTAFLNSKQGVWDIKRRARQSINQTNVNPEEVKQIDIPILDMKIQELIKKCFDKAILKIQNSKTLYTEAETILLQELGLANWQPTIKNNNTKTLKESFLQSGRIDAEYYQPKYDELFKIITNYRNGFIQLKNIGKFLNGSFIPEEFYTQEKTRRAYLRIKELSLDKIINSDDVMFINNNFISTNETRVKEGDFVIATIGNTIGKINRIPQEFDNSFISNNTSKIVLENKNIDSYYFELLMRSIVVQEQVQKEFTQTAQPKISNKSLENIIIPKIDTKTQTLISQKIQESLALQAQSKQLLEAAKTAVEIAIEQGEEEAMGYLSKL